MCVCGCVGVGVCGCVCGCVCVCVSVSVCVCVCVCVLEGIQLKQTRQTWGERGGGGGGRVLSNWNNYIPCGCHIVQNRTDSMREIPLAQVVPVPV